jgi:GTP-binding protein
VIQKEVDGEILEPFEIVVADIEETHQGAVMEEMGRRKGDLLDMVLDGRGRVRLEYRVPSRGMIGFRNEFLTLTSGSGILTSIFDRYDRIKPGVAGVRQNGVLVSMIRGKALAYALYNLQERGRLFMGHGEDVYEGQLIGIHSRGNDLPVNPTKGKQLTNIRAAGTDEALVLTPPIRFTLEQALEFIAEDELVEVTPHHIRLRKKLLREQERKRGKAAP